ncbi:MAG TPA: NAD-dependent protein deacylase [Candidatus Angelobacter sp.]|nr:NAD-dependent protein deacylase [Candidatus Angelobacter sp.]
MKNEIQKQESNPEFLLVLEKLRTSRNILALTGAGISAESNIPTFRGEGGWWRSQDPKQLATFAAFKTNPQFVWEWYEHRREIIAQASPNLAHKALAELESPARHVFIITQNVDDLHERAGSHRVVHIHGSIWTVICLNDGTVFEDRRIPLPALPPLCNCGGMLRPGVVWFDEDLPPVACREIEKYFHATKIDVVLAIGTEATFDYIREWALGAKRSGALLVEINPSKTILTPDVDVRIQGKAGDILTDLRDNLLAETA